MDTVITSVIVLTPERGPGEEVEVGHAQSVPQKTQTVPVTVHRVLERDVLLPRHLHRKQSREI